MMAMYKTEVCTFRHGLVEALHVC